MFGSDVQDSLIGKSPGTLVQESIVCGGLEVSLQAAGRSDCSSVSSSFENALVLSRGNGFFPGLALVCYQCGNLLLGSYAAAKPQDCALGWLLLGFRVALRVSRSAH
jgi:hypothetical protein